MSVNLIDRGAIERLAARGGGCDFLGHGAFAQARPLVAADDGASCFWQNWFVTQRTGEYPEARAEADESNSKNCISHFCPQVASA